MYDDIYVVHCVLNCSDISLRCTFYSDIALAVHMHKSSLCTYVRICSAQAGYFFCCSLSHDSWSKFQHAGCFWTHILHAITRNKLCTYLCILLGYKDITLFLKLFLRYYYMYIVHYTRSFSWHNSIQSP